MTLAPTVAVVMFVGVTLYALLAGADFGGGFWDLLAGDAERGAAPRELIEHSVGPVWEANHVWLIFVLVVLWTGFPRAFAPIMSTLAVPLTLAAVGHHPARLGLRVPEGVDHALDPPRVRRHLRGLVGAHAVLPRQRRRWRRVGTGAGGRNRVADRSWINPTSMLGGVLAVVVCAFLAAVYLTADADRQGSADLTEYFRRRAIAAGVVAGIVAADRDRGAARRLAAPLRAPHGPGPSRPRPSGVAGVATLGLLVRGRYAVARVTAAVAVVAVLWGWAAGQYPFLIEGRLTIAEGQGAHATLQALLATVIAGVVVIGPALAWLPCPRRP